MTQDFSGASSNDGKLKSSTNREILHEPQNGYFKRRRDAEIDVEILADDEDELLGQRAIEKAEISASPQKQICLTDLRVSNLTHPKSLYAGWMPPLPITSEREVTRQFEDENSQDIAGKSLSFSDATDAASGDEFTSYELSEFSIYLCDTARHNSEFVPLHNIATRKKDTFYYFDGILSNGISRRYVQRVPFDRLSIGNYLDLGLHAVDGEVWIQSLLNHKSDRWYRLAKPNPEYARYQDAFMWLANFAKHFVDYLQSHENVCLHDFRSQFAIWMEKLHGDDAIFRKWRQQYPRTDFRSVVAAYPDFLWAESYQIDPAYASHTIWREANHRDLGVIPEQPCKEKRTIVTPFVSECFRNVEWGSLLKPVDISPEQEAASGPPLTRPFRSTEQLWKSGTFKKSKRIRAGDVIGISRDVETRWKDKNEIWFVYVQSVETTKAGRQYILGLWLYTPSETPCSIMNYPFGNELFMSDHCNCADAKIWVDDVVCVVSVGFFQDPRHSRAGFAVRQKYCHADAFFVTLKKSDFACAHRSKDGFKSDLEHVMERFQIGDTVLVENVKSQAAENLEPAVIVHFRQEGAKELVLCRQLLRRSNISKDSEAPPNELVYSDNFLMIPAEGIDRKCHVRFYSEDDRRLGRIPVPYNRNGSGDMFFISTKLVEDYWQQKLAPLKAMPESIIEGFDPNEVPLKPQLRGLDLFCGGGNFGRGLEEGGAMKVQWAVDYFEKAIYTYRANLEDPNDTQLFFGSVNDFLMRSMKRTNDKGIPQPGDVDFISAGSPCQGFSNANRQRDKIEALQNCSLVASVAAFVDYYRPKYAVLENVLGMANKGTSKTKATGVDENIFSQLLCTFVGLGYQVQYFPIDAWSYGSPQSRSRLFVSIAAPGLPLPPPPALSHSHPATIKERSIGMAANNLDFGTRQFSLTPFEFVSIAAATSDLPNIGEGHVQTCIAFPDHRHSRIENLAMRALMSQIPRTPHGQGKVHALKAGRISGLLGEMVSGQRRDSDEDDFIVDSLRALKKAKLIKQATLPKPGPISKSYTRITPGGLMPTVTTTITPRCNYMGKWVHWDQHRTVTIMEARRAQGFPDHEVLVGSTADQWKIVGNSVARPVALAFGLALREAWLAGPSIPPREEPVKNALGESIQNAIILKEETRVSIKTEHILTAATAATPTSSIQLSRHQPRRIVITIDDDDSTESDDPMIDELAGPGNGNGYGSGMRNFMSMAIDHPPLRESESKNFSKHQHNSPAQDYSPDIQISSAPPKRRTLMSLASLNAGPVHSSPLQARQDI